MQRCCECGIKIAKKCICGKTWRISRLQVHLQGSVSAQYQPEVYSSVANLHKRQEVRLIGIDGVQQSTLPEGKSTNLLPKAIKQKWFDKTSVTKQQSFWRNILWTEEFWKRTPCLCLQRKTQGLKSKEVSPYSQTRWRFKDVLMVLCCFWPWMPFMCEQNQEIGLLTKTSGAKHKY